MVSYFWRYFFHLYTSLSSIFVAPVFFKLPFMASFTFCSIFGGSSVFLTLIRASNLSFVTRILPLVSALFVLFLSVTAACVLFLVLTFPLHCCSSFVLLSPFDLRFPSSFSFLCLMLYLVFYLLCLFLIVSHKDIRTIITDCIGRNLEKNNIRTIAIPRVYRVPCNCGSVYKKEC